MELENIFKCQVLIVGMNKELDILRIMKDEKCCWEEAVEKESKRKNLKEFF
jgi:hypothetical protein